MAEAEYTLEIQKLLIQGLISDGTMFTRCQSILKSEYFDSQLKNTVKFILEYTEKYSTLPSTEQIDAHTGIKIEKLSEFNEQHQTSFLDEIQEFCRHKALVNAILKSADLLEKGNPAGIETMIKEAILIGLTKSLGTDYFEDPRARLLKLKDENGTLSTGWASVDKKLYNVGRGELLLFLALSGGGKSVALQNLTLNFALQNLNVVYITLELSEELCAKRIDSMSCDITSSDIYKKLDEVELKVKSLGNRTGDITIKYMPSNTTCTRDIRSYLKEYEIQKGFKPDVLVLDYIDLVAPNDKRISPSDLFIKDKFISEELRNMAKELQLLVATASQLNRSATQELSYDMGMIAGGKSKIDTCDNCIAIRSGQVYRDKGEIEFEYLKTRNSGGVGSRTMLSFDIETLRIIDQNEETAGSQKPKTIRNTLDQIKNRSNKQEEKEDTEEVSLGPVENKASVEHTNSLRALINKTKNK